jgi:hypothetical protein
LSCLTGDVIGDASRGGQPNPLALTCDVLQCPTQMTKPERLADDVGMQRDAHHERLPFRLREHLVEVVDDHVCELSSRVLAGDDRGDVVQFLRIRHREDRPTRAGREPDRLVVHAPVQQVAVAGFRQEIGGEAALRNPGAEPAAWAAALELLDDRGSALDERPLLGFAQGPLPLGIGAAVAHDLVSPKADRVHHLGAMAVDAGVHEHRGR